MSNELKVSQEKYNWLKEFAGQAGIDQLGIAVKGMNEKAVNLGLNYKEVEEVAQPPETPVDAPEKAVAKVDVETAVEAPGKALEAPESEPTVVAESLDASAGADQVKELLQFFATDVIKPLLDTVKSQNVAIAEQKAAVLALTAQLKEVDGKIKNLNMDNTPAVTMAETFKQFLFDGGAGFGKSAKVSKDDSLADSKPASKALATTSDIPESAPTLESFLFN